MYCDIITHRATVICLGLAKNVFLPEFASWKRIGLPIQKENSPLFKKQSFLIFVI